MDLCNCGGCFCLLLREPEGLRGRSLIFILRIMKESALFRSAAVVSIKRAWRPCFLLGGHVGCALDLLRPGSRWWGWCAAPRLGLWRAFRSLRLRTRGCMNVSGLLQRLLLLLLLGLVLLFFLFFLLVFLGLLFLRFVGLGGISGDCFRVICGG